MGTLSPYRLVLMVELDDHESAAEAEESRRRLKALIETDPRVTGVATTFPVAAR